MRRLFFVLTLLWLLTACGGETTDVAESPPEVEVAVATEPPAATTAPSVADSATEATAPTEAPEPTEATAPTEAAIAPTTAPTEVSAPVEELPAYLTVMLTDVRTGEQFRIVDRTAEGKYVLLEMMAVW